MHKKSLYLLYGALFINYLGDYCSLIGTMEYAKTFGALDKVVKIFIMQALPPLILALIGKSWAQRQTQPTKQIGYFCLLATLPVLSLLHTINYMHLLLVSLILGF